MSMCFVLEWKTELWARAIDPWLSPFSGITIWPLFSFPPILTSNLPNSSSLLRAISRSCWIFWIHMFLSETLIKAYCWLGYKKSNSISKRCSQVTFFTANVKVMYLALVEKKATVGYFCEHQRTGPPLSMKTKPEVDFQLFLSPAQSESEYPFTNRLSCPP